MQIRYNFTGFNVQYSKRSFINIRFTTAIVFAIDGAFQFSNHSLQSIENHSVENKIQQNLEPFHPLKMVRNPKDLIQGATNIDKFVILKNINNKYQTGLTKAEQSVHLHYDMSVRARPCVCGNLGVGKITLKQNLKRRNEFVRAKHSTLQTGQRLQKTQKFQNSKI